MASRSYLFVPGNRPDRFQKAWEAGADAVIVDLEDAVPAEQKAGARQTISGWLSPNHPVYVRVNGPATPWFQHDVEAVARPGLAGIVLPKTEDPKQVAGLGSFVGSAGKVIPLIETARGLWEARGIAEALRVERLAFGAIDFQLDTGIDGEDEELLYARSQLVLASRVASVLPPIDGITSTLDDVDRLRRDVERARRLGFGGKLCIHPRQVQDVNRGFSPTETEIAWARRVLEAADLSGGASRVDGEMIDRPLLERAKRIVEQNGS